MKTRDGIIRGAHSIRAVAVLATATIASPQAVTALQTSRSPWGDGGNTVVWALPDAHLQPSGEQPSVIRPVVGGLLLGGAGWFIGALAGLGIESAAETCNTEMCFSGIVFGGATGGTLGMALGIHLGNRRLGNYALDFVTAAAIWGAGVGVYAASDKSGIGAAILAVGVPVTQMVATVIVEKS